MKEAIVSRLTVGYVRGYFKGSTHSRTHVQLFRYGFVAAIAFAVDFGTLAVLVSGFDVWYLEAAAIAFILGLLTNYGLSTLWVFQGYSNSSRKKEFLTFLVTGLIGLGLTELLIWAFTSGLGIHYLASKLITAFIVVMWNFSSRKVLLYRS